MKKINFSFIIEDFKQEDLVRDIENLIKEKYNIDYTHYSGELKYAEVADASTTDRSGYFGATPKQYPTLVGIIAKHMQRDEEYEFDKFVQNIKDELDLIGIEYEYYEDRKEFISSCDSYYF
jgi:hypothetical protein